LARFCWSVGVVRRFRAAASTLQTNLPAFVFALSFLLHANTAGTLSADISNRPLCGGLKQKKSANKTIGFIGVSNWLRGLDLNQRPSGYEPDRFVANALICLIYSSF